MHVPPYHKKRSWQIFFLGVVAGALIGYTVLTYMHGKMYEEVLTDNIRLESEINEIKRQNEALLQDKEDLEEQTSPVILSVSIHFINSKALRLDKLITHQLEDLIKHELDPVIGNQVDSVGENAQLVIDLIENKTFTIDDLSYEVKVRQLTVTEKLELSLSVKLSK